MPLCYIPEVVFWARLVRDKVEPASKSFQALLLGVQKLPVIAPGGVIRAGAHHVQVDRPVLAFQCWLQALQTTQQELCLRADAVGEVVDAVVCQVENGIGHYDGRSACGSFWLKSAFIWAINDSV